MKQNLIKIIWIILVLLVVIICISTMGNVSAINPNSEKIAELTFKLSELEFSKMNCLDNLTYKQSVEQEKWFTKYCVEYDEQIMEIQTEIENLKADYSMEQQQREPWMLNESWDAQVMPNIVADTSHERFKELCEAYWLDASTIWQVENHYWITEWLLTCVMVAETSWWKKGYWKSNPGNVWNNDRGDRVTFALFETWIEKIAQTLNNKYLWKKQTLWCLSNAWHCVEPWDNWARYATSTSNWEKNMVGCLSTIYGKIDPSTFNIRQR